MACTRASVAACCGCGAAAEDVNAGSAEPLPGFDISARTWSEIYVPQDMEKTLEKVEVRVRMIHEARAHRCLGSEFRLPSLLQSRLI